MSQSLADILGNKSFSEPPEMRLIKDFVKDNFGHVPSVKITESGIIIVVPSAAMAGALRMRLLELQEKLDTKKRLSIRIGN